MSSPEEDGSKAATPMAQHSIAYNGRIYQVGLFQYDQLADAIAYAQQQLMELRAPASYAGHIMRNASRNRRNRTRLQKI